MLTKKTHTRAIQGPLGLAQDAEVLHALSQVPAFERVWAVACSDAAVGASFLYALPELHHQHAPPAAGDRLDVVVLVADEQAHVSETKLRDALRPVSLGRVELPSCVRV